MEESHGYDNFPQHIQNHTTEQCQITAGDSINPEELPQLKEDWDNGQFADADTNLINRHNTHSESERIRREYTQHLLDLSYNQYIFTKRIPQINCSIPAQIQTITGYHQGDHRHNLMILTGITLHPRPCRRSTLACTGRGKCALLYGHRLFGEKTQSAESRKARKRRQNYKQQMKKLSF